jgi:uncharacterized protein (TIGR02217 family)
MPVRPTAVSIGTCGRLFDDSGVFTLPDSGGSENTLIADFEEIQFPTDISRGAKGGPMFKTVVTMVNSGAEKRIALWDKPLFKWDVSMGARTATQAQALTAFFIARRGRAVGFRFKDWSDYRVERQNMQNVSVDVWKMVKRYTSGGVTVVRPILKPVEDTVTVYNALDNLIDPADYTVDYAIGQVTFSVSPFGTPRFETEFDVPVRFENDEMELVQEDVDIRNWEGINVVELRF